MLLKLLAIVALLISVESVNPRFFRKKHSLLNSELKLANYQDATGLSYRLPNDTMPLHYEIELETNVHKAEFAFNGSVRILVKALRNTNSITLHSRQLTINNIQILTTDSMVITNNAEFRFEEDVEFLIISLPEELMIDYMIFIKIQYNGLLRDDNMGFYHSSYLNADKNTVYLATTQFESTDARHAFPCFDEPGIRSTFQLTLKHDKSYTAISNTRSSGRSSVPDTNYVVTTFEETPLMQTYLLAFIISDFTYVQNSDETLRQRVYAKKQSISAGEGNMALEMGEKVMRKMEDHFGVKYSLPKMDQVAVPDFDAGAMENWGLVTYREEYLLFSAKSTSFEREDILTTIAHEFAHQFFGNLVSPKWWSYLWLNEGFATLYAHYLADLVYPEERLMDTFVVDTMHSVLRNDIAINIRPMTYYVESPEEIDNLFDYIAYSKSGSVLRMMQLALSVETFTKGLNYYLKDNAFKSVDPDDLYSNLQRAVDEDYKSPLNVKTIMSSWEHQNGYPLVTVTRNADNIITLTQDRFMNGSNGTNWWIPINYVSGSNPNFTSTAPDMWMQGEKTVTISGVTANKSFTVDDWMIFNIQETSYYRVNYDDNLWKFLINQLTNGFEKIHPVNRAQLIDDSFSLADHEIMNYAIPFSILHYMNKETDSIPWAAAYRNILLINSKLTGTRIYSLYKKFIASIVTALYNKLGVNVIANEPTLDRYARSIATDLACKADMTNCLNETALALHNMIATNAVLDPDVTKSIYCNGLRSGNDNAFMFLLSKMQRSEDQAERSLIINALGCSPNLSLLTMYLYSAVAPGSSYHHHEKYQVLSSIVNQGQLKMQLTMDFIANNYEIIQEEIPNGIERILRTAASCVTTEDQLKELNELTMMLGEKGVVKQNVDAINREIAQSNLNWIAKNLDDIEEYLGGSTDPITSTIQPDSTTAGVESSTSSFTIFIISLIVLLN